MQPLKFIALSGTTSITENLYVYEYGNEMIVVDCGVGFPGADMFGVDLVIPDFGYIKRNKNKLKAILVTHGHEDHLGALPFLLREVNAPIYATKLVAGFIEDKFIDYKQTGQRINVFNPESDVLTFGSFKVTPFRISHSVPDSVGFAIDTPQGKMLHVPDYKFDWTPVDNKPFDIAKLAVLSKGGVLAVASDCLGATSEGYTHSEREIEKRFENIAKSAKKKIILTTISSNVSRVQQAMNVAARLGRKVAIIGWSVDKKAEIAKRLGYLHYPNNLVINPRQASRLPDEKLFYIVSGSYGQPGSSLYRASIGDHKLVRINADDTVIFSGDPAPPGSKAAVDFVVDRLIDLGADVHYYDTQEDLHVSGHGSIEDINMLLAITKPKYYIPIGGSIRHMRAYKGLAVDNGASPGNVFELKPGDQIEFQNGKARLGKRIPVKEVMVDGLGIGDVGKIVLRDRQVLSEEGVVIVVIQIDSRSGKVVDPIDIISRGFVFKGARDDLLKEGGKKLSEKLSKINLDNRRGVKEISANFLQKFFQNSIGRRPMILPVVVEV